MPCSDSGSPWEQGRVEGREEMVVKLKDMKDRNDHLMRCLCAIEKAFCAASPEKYKDFCKQYNEIEDTILEHQEFDRQRKGQE